MTFTFHSLAHVQLAAPNGAEQIARDFFSGILQMKEVEKPENLKKRGGVWFEFASYQVHIGIEEPFSPAKKAHPAFEVGNIESLKEHLTANGITYLEDDALPNANRIYVFDPFGNRLEMLEWKK